MNNDVIELSGFLKLEDGTKYKTLAQFCKKIYTTEEKVKYEIINSKWKKLLVPQNEQEYKQKFGIRYKYRPYFKAIKEELSFETEENILTFIMFNPSLTHQFTLDDTVKNCLKLTQKGKFNGFEVLNLLNIRNPSIDCLNICDDDSNVNLEINPKFKNVVFAWGCRNFCPKGISILNDRLKSFLIYHNDETEYYTFEKDKTRHPGRQAWTKTQGRFDAASLFKINNLNINNLKILKNGQIKY